MKVLIKYLIVIALLPLALPSAVAKPGMMGQGGMMGKKIFSQLDLTSEQEKQIDILMLEAKIEQVKLGKIDMKAHKKECLSLLKQDKFDEKQAAAMISSHQAQKALRKMIMLKARHQAYQLLSSEQKAQFELLVQQAAMMQGQGMGRGKGMGRNQMGMK